MANSFFSLGTEAQSFGLLDPKLCYLLDGILFIYGVIVTALYLRAKVGSPGLLREDVGSSTGRMCGGALALESLRPGLCLVSMGKAGDNQAGTAGGWRRWGTHQWQTEQVNGPSARCITEGWCQCLDVSLPCFCWQTVG